MSYNKGLSEWAPTVKLKVANSLKHLWNKVQTEKGWIHFLEIIIGAFLLQKSNLSFVKIVNIQCMGCLV